MKRTNQLTRTWRSTAHGFCVVLMCSIGPSCAMESSDIEDSNDLAATEGALAHAPTCGEELSQETVMNCVQDSKYLRTLRSIASRPRPSGSTHWKSVQGMCRNQLKRYGFDVELHQYGTGANVIGVRKGKTRPQEQVLLSAHYDSVPGCRGADDNGTGVAWVLEAARILSQYEFDRTLVAACWDEEESGKLGSKAYAQRAKARGDQIVANYVFEMIGYKDTALGSQAVSAAMATFFPQQTAELAARGNPGDFIALVADDLSAEAATRFGEAAKQRGLAMVRLDIPSAFKNHPALMDLRRSDHASFWDAGFSGLMLTDTANYRNPRYLCAGGLQDVIAPTGKNKDMGRALDIAFATDVVAATIGAAVEMLRAPIPHQEAFANLASGCWQIDRSDGSVYSFQFDALKTYKVAQVDGTPQCVEKGTWAVSGFPVGTPSLRLQSETGSYQALPQTTELIERKGSEIFLRGDDLTRSASLVSQDCETLWKACRENPIHQNPFPFVDFDHDGIWNPEVDMGPVTSRLLEDGYISPWSLGIPYSVTGQDLVIDGPPLETENAIQIQGFRKVTFATDVSVGGEPESLTPSLSVENTELSIAPHVMIRSRGGILFGDYDFRACTHIDMGAGSRINAPSIRLAGLQHSGGDGVVHIHEGAELASHRVWFITNSEMVIDPGARIQVGRGSLYAQGHPGSVKEGLRSFDVRSASIVAGSVYVETKRDGASIQVLDSAWVQLVGEDDALRFSNIMLFSKGVMNLMGTNFYFERGGPRPGKNWRILPVTDPLLLCSPMSLFQSSQENDCEFITL